MPERMSYCIKKNNSRALYFSNANIGDQGMAPNPPPGTSHGNRFEYTPPFGPQPGLVYSTAPIGNTMNFYGIDPQPAANVTSGVWEWPNDNNLNPSAQISIQYNPNSLNESSCAPQYGAREDRTNQNVTFSESLETNLGIYPNPSQGILEVNVNDLESIDDLVQIEILDLCGRKIAQYRLTPQNSSIYLEPDLSNGTYLLRARSENKILGTHPFVLMR
jgi:hypothetical protein